MQQCPSAVVLLREGMVLLMIIREKEMIIREGGRGKSGRLCVLIAEMEIALCIGSIVDARTTRATHSLEL